MTIQEVNITPIGSRIVDSRTSIPELAKVSLDRYSNNRLKQLKLVTKAFKYNFPFYDGYSHKKAFVKFFSILKSHIERAIPYLEEAKVVFLDFYNDTIFIRLGPRDTNDDELFHLVNRYARYITYIARRHSAPILLSVRQALHINQRLVDGRARPYNTMEEERANMFNVVELRCTLNMGESSNGYLLLYYVEQILKVLETLHRKAHYADSTVTRT
jgi:hypothetical protein